jgi:hypothetical protein
MSSIIAPLCLFPVLALALRWRAGLKPAETLRVLLLFALGLGAAAPFLTSRGLGTSDSVNYSNSVADSVTQLRAGVFPVYVGQSDYAFNGRVHPLRTAPYFTYGTGLLDVLARHRLTFWELQNLLMAGSLVGAAFSAYLCLRKLETVGPWTAWLLAVAYLSAPGLLAAAYGMDLYMTVNTAPFLPIALLGLVRTFDDRTFGHVGLFAVGLAACWLAHPPVAAWLSLGSGIVLVIGLIVHPPRWRDLAVVPAGILFWAALSAYGFVSSGTIDPNLISSHYAPAGPGFAGTVASMTGNAWRGSLLPVSRNANALSDFQLGYALWLLLLLGAGMALRRRGAGVARALGAMILFYLLALTPVPWLHRKLWEYLPASIATMTNFWPMQRIYLLLSIAIVFLAARVWPRGHRPQPILVRWVIPVVLLAGTGWSGWQAWQFIRRGFSTRFTEEQTVATHRLENANLTLVAYAFLGYPSWFSFGPMDPEQDLHLLSPVDLSVIVSNSGAGHLRPAAAAGRLTLARVSGHYSNRLEPQITLEPGKRYRLRFHFLIPKFVGWLFLRGETTWRDFILPSYLGAKGFGMEPGNSPEITLFTTSSRPEHIQLSVERPGGDDLPSADFADFSLEEIDRTALPLQLVQLVPFFECRLTAPQACWLETPRMYIEGYAASVDGKPAVVARSNDSMAMVAVPAGKHTVQLRFAGSPLLRRTFWLALGGWAAVAAGLVALVASGALGPGARSTRPQG